jgi:hypothetical protein
MHFFNYRDGKISFYLEDIEIRRGKLKIQKLKIYDSFVDIHDNLLLLVDYEEEIKDNEPPPCFWITSKQISGYKITAYVDKLKEFLSKDFTETSSCNTTKVILFLYINLFN